MILELVVEKINSYLLNFLPSHTLCPLPDVVSTEWRNIVLKDIGTTTSLHNHQQLLLFFSTSHELRVFFYTESLEIRWREDHLIHDLAGCLVHDRTGIFGLCGTIDGNGRLGVYVIALE